MKVISTELLIRTASKAMFEENENFDTDIQHVIDFLQIMADRYGFEIKIEEEKK